jgi:YHS domain-containing protein
MKYISLLSILWLFPLPVLAAPETPAARSPRDALQPFNDLIGDWRATGVPEDKQEPKQSNFWTESLKWSWQFKADDAWLAVAFNKGKYFSKGELRYLPAQDAYQLTLRTLQDEALAFTGTLKGHHLTLERKDDRKKESQRLVVSVLHENRFLYRYEVKADDRPSFVKLYQVGATKEGVPFATGDGAPECVVSGGRGTMKVTYKGQTYYVCCGGCRDAFKEDPEKFIKEYEARKAKKAAQDR